MSSDVVHLFAYGTLMTWATGGLGTAQRARLQREATSLGPATMQGQLYNLGTYPGLVLCEDTSQIVHGEVLALHDAERSLGWLDAYEGIVPGRLDDDGYERIAREAILADGSVLLVWVYVHRRAALAGHPIPGGQWIADPSEVKS